MAYGTLFLALLESALEKEEAKLNELAAICQRQGICPSLQSVRQFDEGWISYILAIEQMDSSRCPALHFGTGRTDAYFVSGEKVLAAFKLKGPLRSSLSKTNAQKVLDNFTKQSQIAKPNLETYVVLLLHGSQSELRSYVEEITTNAAQAARITCVQISKDIPLNLDGEMLRICSFRVEARVMARAL